MQNLAILLWCVMAERFIKFIPSEEAMWLLKNKHHAFRLLTIIAESARRYEGAPDGLKVGECFIGGHKNYGMSEQNYRTAKDVLEKRQHIEIVETSRTRKKSTNGVTTEGTKVKILSSSIWDINSEEGNERINERVTNDQRTGNDKLRKIRKKKKEEEEEELPQTPSFSLHSKIKFRELVELTQEEYDSLLAKNGQEFLNLMLDTLDSYKGSSGKKYDSDFHTMKQGGWVVSRVKKDLKEQKTPNEKFNKSSHGEKSNLNSQPSQAKFQPGRILRGSNEGQIDKRCVNE